MGHTKGPWEVRCDRKPYAVGPVGVDPTSPSGQAIGVVFKGQVRGSADEQLANARLIAAAPEMKEALVEIDDLMAQKNEEELENLWKIDEKIIAIIHTALAKAEGQVNEV